MSSVLNRDNPDPDRYRSVYVLCEVGDIVYEICYGHLNEIYVKPGDISRPGTILGTAGDVGPAYAGGVLVAKAQKLAGSRPARPCMVRRCASAGRRRSPAASYCSTAMASIKDGYFYEILDYDNGFVGC